MQFHGKAAHAAAAPWEGRNALDAAVLGYMNIAAMRQHIRPTERIHGIFTKGGDKANIVPAETAMEWIVRSPTIESLQPLKQRVLTGVRRAPPRPARARSTTNGTAHTYADMIDNGPMVAAYVGQRGTRRPNGGRPRRRRSAASSAAPTWATSATSCRRSTR